MQLRHEMNSSSRIYLITKLEATNQTDQSPEHWRLSAIRLQPQNNNKQKGGDKKKKHDVGDARMKLMFPGIVHSSCVTVCCSHLDMAGVVSYRALRFCTYWR